ncbi:molecular chaperone HtpG [Magnetococcales bacterium HHB-1]
MGTQETKQFQTEVKQLLHLMIHSLYSNKEIFLRELISNASDALDKLRFEALSNDALYEGKPDLNVHLTFDKENRTITLRDNGIGMNREEVVENIGTIARSGTREFLKNMTGDKAKDANLIGQFGVGFYSAFIVADQVTLSTRKAGDEATNGVLWSSAGDGEYSLETIHRPERGTEVTLHLREEDGEFLDDWRLRNIVQKFSDHIDWPIMMIKPEPPKTEEDPDAPEEAVIEGEEKAPEWEAVNKASALWTRPKNEIKDEEYNEFYKHIGHDFEDPLDRLHVRLEGKYEYTLLLYIPKRAPFNLWDRDRKHGVKLYVRRVFIMEGAEELLPRYLRFVSGIVDSSDLPLNISREILQNNPVIEAIKRGAVDKIFGLLEYMAKENSEDYAEFWKNFGQVLKEGVIEDFSNKARVSKLLRFHSTHDEKTEEQTISLEDYVSRMKEGQEAIYYVSGATRSAAASSPHLEIFRKKGIEVLLLSDRIDEWLTQHMSDFDGKKLQSVAKGALDLEKLDDQEGEDKKEDLKKKEDTLKDLVTRMQKALEADVKEVRLTQRLTDSPSCLVGDEYDMSSSMERILREAGQAVPDSKRILEINPDHPLITRLNSEADETRFGEWSHIIYEQAMLSEGGQLKDPASFVQRLNKLVLALSDK